MTRSEKREQAFIIVFGMIFNPEVTACDAAEAALASGFIEGEKPAGPAPSADDGSGEPAEPSLRTDPFVMSLVNAVAEHTDDIDQRISACLRGWKIDRISRVSLAALRLSTAELLYMTDIPVSVSINEAVELTKKYASSDDDLLQTVCCVQSRRRPAGNELFRGH